MERRTFLAGLATTTLGISFAGPPRKRGSRFQMCLLKVGSGWADRKRALIKLSFEIQKRCNIPVETHAREATLQEVTKVDSPFFIISGGSAFDPPSVEDARLIRLALGAGGILLFDDTSPEKSNAFYQSAIAFMSKVYPELTPRPLPADHALYQSYYLLKEPRGRLNKRNYLEGWSIGHRTTAFFSHNDLLGAMEADQLGTWKHNMEIGGGFRRELCFRLGINMAYYTLTINYKKDRAFPPIIERRRRQ